ncbi:YtxH domain-containing protein [Paenibacillus sp. LjRoot56]|uniref:YtxH domain-containing protein n=1 Tax=Paenibacillus sp. LjRoot56 TaxID=3342333 RepID=UPI003ECF1A4D
MSEVVETNKGGLWLGLMIGGAVGAIASLLVAPKAGSKLRQDLMSTYRTWQDKTKELASSVSESSKALAETLSDSSKALAETVSQKTEDLVDTAKETAKESQHRVTDSIQAAKTTFQNN